MLSEAAQRRLAQYCLHYGDSPGDRVVQLVGGHERLVPMAPRHLRMLIWRDVEVRDALLADRFDELAALVPAGERYNLLDLATAVSHEARQQAA